MDELAQVLVGLLGAAAVIGTAWAARQGEKPRPAPARVRSNDRRR